MNIYETVKIVNGYAITRMIGTHGFYMVATSANVYYKFRTIKAAAEFCNSL